MSGAIGGVHRSGGHHSQFGNREVGFDRGDRKSHEGKKCDKQDDNLEQIKKWIQQILKALEDLEKKGKDEKSGDCHGKDSDEANQGHTKTLQMMWQMAFQDQGQSSGGTADSAPF